MHTLKILTVAFLMLEASGCGCTQVGCNDNVQITLKKASLPWEPGTYAFAVDADGKKASCTVVLPFAKDSDVVCSNLELLQVTLSEVDTSDAMKGVDSLRLFLPSEKVSVTVSRDGTQLAAQSFTPTYEVSEPNGPACGPTCKGATEKLALP